MFRGTALRTGVSASQGGQARSQGIMSQNLVASLTSWILLRRGYRRFDTGTFIHMDVKESVVYEQYAENTYYSHKTEEQNRQELPINL